MQQVGSCGITSGLSTKIKKKKKKKFAISNQILL